MAIKRIFIELRVSDPIADELSKQQLTEHLDEVKTQILNNKTPQNSGVTGKDYVMEITTIYERSRPH